MARRTIHNTCPTETIITQNSLRLVWKEGCPEILACEYAKHFTRQGKAIVIAVLTGRSVRFLVHGLPPLSHTRRYLLR